MNNVSPSKMQEVPSGDHKNEKLTGEPNGIVKIKIYKIVNLVISLN